jgi:protein-disulfide isomerase
MQLTRRSSLSLAGGVLVGVLGVPGWRRSGVPAASAAPAPQDEAAHEAERSLGDPGAKVTVAEYFSLTCIHCADFSRETMPQIEKELVQTGKVRFVYHDFPLDQVALTAALVSRYLPPERYYPFVTALFANQDRWAFARGINTTEEIWKIAALAGMSRASFDQAIADTALRDWILQQQQVAQDQVKVDSTPSFVIGGKKTSGEMSYDAFKKLLPEA